MWLTGRIEVPKHFPYIIFQISLFILELILIRVNSCRLSGSHC